jgi:predicted RNA-binding protein YlxR (DUF448 family)
VQETSASVPVRQCAGCRERKLQAAMRRFVRQGATWLPDARLGAKTIRLPGRGVYLCSAECVKRVEKNRKYPGLAAAAAEYGLQLG